MHVNGNIEVDNTTAVTAYQRRPANLKIYQAGNGRTFTANNDVEITASIMAPGTDFVARNKLTFYGTAVFRTIEAKNQVDIYVDERAIRDGAGGTAALVQ